MKSDPLYGYLSEKVNQNGKGSEPLLAASEKENVHHAPSSEDTIKATMAQEPNVNSVTQDKKRSKPQLAAQENDKGRHQPKLFFRSQARKVRRLSRTRKMLNLQR